MYLDGYLGSTSKEECLFNSTRSALHAKEAHAVWARGCSPEHNAMLQSFVSRISRRNLSPHVPTAPLAQAHLPEVL